MWDSRRAHVYDQILARWRPGDGQAWYLADKQGTIREVLDASGGVIGSRVFDTFGRVVSSSGSVDRFAYQGREWEDAVGLYQFRSRWYDPQTGQFVSEDGLGFAAGDANLRRFVFNDPLRFTDPSGHLAIPEYAVHGARAAAGAMIENVFICLLINALFNIGMEQVTGREPTGKELRFQLALCVAFAIPGATFAGLEAMSAHNAMRAAAAAASARAAAAEATAAAQTAHAAGAPYKAAMRKADQAGLAAGRANLAARRVMQASGREAAEAAAAAKQAQRYAQEAKAAAEAAEKASKNALGKVQPKTLPMTPKGPPPGAGRGPGAPGAKGTGRVAPATGVGRTAPGPAYLGPNDLYLQNARTATPLPGYYDVAVHGSATGVELRTASGAVRLSNHRALAKVIQRMPDYHGQPIRLASCCTGQLPNGFAQNLSNKLGVEVLAPNTWVWSAPANGLPVLSATPSGQIVIFQPGADNFTVTAPTRIPGFPDPVPTYPPTGQWYSFQPGGGRP